MALDGKLLRRAQDRVDARRAENERRLAARTREVYARLPRVQELDGLLQQTAARVFGEALRSGGDPVRAISAL